MEKERWRKRCLCLISWTCPGERAARGENRVRRWLSLSPCLSLLPPPCFSTWCHIVMIMHSFNLFVVQDVVVKGLVLVAQLVEPRPWVQLPGNAWTEKMDALNTMHVCINMSAKCFTQSCRTKLMIFFFYLENKRYFWEMSLFFVHRMEVNVTIHQCLLLSSAEESKL